MIIGLNLAAGQSAMPLIIFCAAAVRDGNGRICTCEVT